ncbi:Zn(II)2Cys6 transcription factor [Aspergillus melleus]|uniref:Zn(II)2Cys6 transcription factor n=1 Tax=Aspergillus melleus TaxID=138277 RepID=UPI001E8E4BE8|nr:uncharacterized protein LDX57_011542 [Aspergillus melleus]KAH8433906.1 hypothetical protein LDX57_011542 [Aspergillus melleus]
MNSLNKPPPAMVGRWHVTQPAESPAKRRSDARPSAPTATMKRKDSSQLPDPAPKRRPRQDPVSCDSCRRKKLKCNRQQPCESCVTRKLTCSYSPGVSVAPLSKTAAHDDNRTDCDSTQPYATDGPRISAGVPPPSAPVCQQHPQQRYSRESAATADLLEHIHMGARVPTAAPRWLRDDFDETMKRGLLSIGSPNSPSGAQSSLPMREWNASRENPATINLIHFVPTRQEATALFRYYSKYVDYLYHIIILKRAEAQINGVYECIERGSPVKLDHLALLFSIAASALYLQLSSESSPYSEICCQEFTFLTGAALIQNNHSASPTLEGLQAVMLVVHYVCNLSSHESVSALFIHGAVVSQAKSLMLHCIDSPRTREARDQSKVDPVEVEIKRRLWWDITSSEWFLGFLSGPQEWTYQIYPTHMSVNQPRNVDDEALEKNPSLASSPKSVPTDMSFTLERLKLSFVIRDIIDKIAYEQLNGLEIDYSKILELDRKIHQALSEVPEFFRLDPGSRRRFANLYKERPTLAWQRCVLQQAYYSRICRLHRQFFIRGAREPTYSYSHVICLQSARKVLEIKRIMDEEEPKFTPPSSVVWSVMHHIFMAAVILLLDVCFNWDDILGDKRKEEVLDACRILSKAQQSSCLVKEGIQAMMNILQKHWKNDKLAVPGGTQLNQPSSLVVGPAEDPTQPVIVPFEPNDKSVPVAQTWDSAPNVPTNQFADGDERQLEDVWSEFLENGYNYTFEDADWTGLLTELTSATIPCG